jgi:hypothetical protein
MSAMKDEILSTVEAIDWVFGDGYAKKNPELVGRLLQSNALTFGAFQISEAIHTLAEPAVEDSL